MKYSHDGDAAHAITMDAAAMGQYATRVGGMFAYLDREAVKARRERNYRRTLRKLPPRLRRFVRILRHVVEDVPGPETEHRKKVCKALKIKDRMYLYLLRALREKLV